MNDKFTYTSRLFDRAQVCELSDDFTLPDYMPAIGRVISCNAAVATPTLYLGGGSAEYAGGIRYSVFYESPDDSSLWCAELPAEYDLLLNDNSLPRDTSTFSYLPSISAENISARVTAPRKLTLKSRVKISPELRIASEAETIIHGDNMSDGLRSLTGQAERGEYTSVSCTPISYKETLTKSEFGLSHDDEFRIISSRAEAAATHVQIADGSINCRGDIYVHISYTKEGDAERPRKTVRKLPFSETLVLPNKLSENAQIVGIRAIGSCPSVSVNLLEDNVEIETNLVLCAEIAAITEISYIKDAFSKNTDYESSKRKIKIPHPIACFNGNATVSTGKPLAELSIDSGMRLFDICASLLPDVKTDLEKDGRFTASGKIRISAIADNGAELIPIEFETDMKYMTDILESSKDLPINISLTATVCDVKGRIDSERLVCDCEVYISCLIEIEEEIEAIDEINLTPSTGTQRISSYIRVCYPADNESLWDIAKRYRIDPEIISENNSLEQTAPIDSPDSLCSNKFLII